MLTSAKTRRDPFCKQKSMVAIDVVSPRNAINRRQRTREGPEPACVPWRSKLRHMLITRVPCRSRNEGSFPRAQKFGDLITADHKVLNEGFESQNNHRYVVVVQDLASQWILSYLCKTKTSKETVKSLQKFLESSQKAKVIFTDNSLEFGISFEELSWNHRTSTPYRSETNGLAERAVRRVKEGTSVELLQFGLDDKCWSDSMKCHCVLRNVQDLVSDGKTPYERRFGESKKTNYSIWCTAGISPKLRERQSENSSIRKENITRKLSRLCFDRGVNLERRHSDCWYWRIRKVGASEIYPWRLNAKEVLITQKDGKFVFPVADGSATLSVRDYEFQESTLRREPTVIR